MTVNSAGQGGAREWGRLPHDTSLDADSALLVPVPEAAPLVRMHRLRLAPDAAVGIPEHITLIFPFIPPGQLDVSVRERLASLFVRVRPFRFQLTSIGWFGDQTMWLAPEPAAPFIDLTRQLVDEFGVPPYEGAFAEIRPHLTVAQENPEGARQAAAEIGPHLPIPALGDRVHLMVGGEATGWRLLEEYLFRG